MAAETLRPDALLVQTGLTGAVTAIDEDPDASAGDWLTTTNNTPTTCRVSFPTPTGTPTVGAGLQEIRVLLRKTNHSTNPTYTVDLYENGSLVANLIASTTLSSTTGVVAAATWNASLLGTPDGSLVEVVVTGTPGGGSPGNRASVEIGAIEWNATTTPAAQNVTAPTLASGATLFVPTLAAAVAAATIAAGSVLFAPTVAFPAQDVTAPTLAAGSVLFAPTVAPDQLVTASTITSTITFYAPTVALGGVTTCFIRTSSAGGDGTSEADSGANAAYANLAAAMIAEARDLGGDTLIFDCSVGSGTAADTSFPDVSGFSNGSILIRAHAGEEATDEWSETKYRLKGTGAGAGSMLDLIDAIPITLHRIQLDAAFTSSGGDRAIHALTGTSGELFFDGIHLRFSGSIADYTGIYMQVNRPYKIRNMIIDGFPTIGFRQYASGGAGILAILHNVTIANCGTAYHTNSTRVLLKNCLATGNGADTGGTTGFHADSDYNAGEDGTMPGANSNPSATFSFVGSTYQPAADDTGARDQGVDLSGDANLAVLTDIRGTARTGTFDIGAIIAADSGDQNLTGATIASGSVVNAPSVAYRIEAPSIVSGVALFAPSMAAVVEASSIASGNVLTPPTISYHIQVPVIGSGTVVSAPSLAQAVDVSSISSGNNLFSPSIAYAIDVPTIASGTIVSSPTLISEIEVSNIGSGAILFAPTITTSDSLSLPVINSTVVLTSPELTLVISIPQIGIGSVLFTPTVAGSDSVSPPRIESTVSVTAPTLSVDVNLGTIGTGVVLYTPSIAQIIDLPSIGSSVQLFPVELSLVIESSSIPSGVLLFTPIVIESGALAIPVIDSTLVLYSPSIALSVGSEFISSGHSLNPPTISYGIVGAFISSQYVLNSPTVTGSLGVSVILSGSVLYAPALSGAGTLDIPLSITVGRITYNIPSTDEITFTLPSKAYRVDVSVTTAGEVSSSS